MLTSVVPRDSLQVTDVNRNRGARGGNLADHAVLTRNGEVNGLATRNTTNRKNLRYPRQLYFAKANEYNHPDATSHPLTLRPGDNPYNLRHRMHKTDDEVQPAACFVLREEESTPGTKPGKVPARVSKLSREVVVASTGPPARQRERNIYVTLGSGTYVVMCAAFMAGMEGSFKVRA